jgi:hypothetical protein
MDSWKPLDTIPAPPITEVDNNLQQEFSQDELYFTQVAEIDSQVETVPYNEQITAPVNTLPEIVEPIDTDVDEFKPETNPFKVIGLFFRLVWQIVSRVFLMLF